MLALKIGRNDLCPCGSGLKFKKCHDGREEDLITQKTKKEVIEFLKQQLDFYISSSLIEDYPNGKIEIEKMIKYVASFDNGLFAIKNPNFINDEDQIFERVHHFGKINDDGSKHDFPVCYAWSIEILKKIREEYSLKKEKFKLKELVEFISYDLLDSKFLKSNNVSDDPIFVIEYHQAVQKEKWIVDGNHRAAATYKKNVNGILEGYYFSPELHIRALIYDYMRLLYVIRTNLNRMVEYKISDENVPELLSLDLINH